MTRIYTNTIETSSDKFANFGCPSFTYDQNGFDKTAIEFFQMVKRAHSEANVSYPLEFIHLGHDEPVFNTRTLFGDCKTGAGPAGKWNVLNVDETCAADKLFIENFSGIINQKQFNS